MTYFSDACTISCERARAFEERIDDIRRNWRDALRPRANSAADLLIDALPSTPVVSVESAAQLIGRSREAARNAISSLVNVGILHQSAKNRKSNIFAARDVLDAFTSYERALAVPGGDTASEKVARHVPQRAQRR